MRTPTGWTRLASAQGFRGPRGNEIELPIYGSSGRIAHSLSELERGRGLRMLVLGGRPLDVMMTGDRLLVVSFPLMEPDLEPVSLSYDAWSRVKSARDVAETLAIVLTRIEVTMGEAAREGRPFVPPPLPAFDSESPFPGFRGLKTDYANNWGTSSGKPFSGVFRNGIKLGTGVLGFARWTVQGRLNGGELSISETRDGRVVAAYAPEGDLTPPERRASFVAERSTPETALDAIVAAITYRAPKD